MTARAGRRRLPEDPIARYRVGVRRAGSVLTAALAYLSVGVFAWWHVWSAAPGSTVTSSGWGDPAQQIWYLAWVPHALANGLDPFVTHAMFAPGGVNLMVNSSILFPAFVATPLTLLAGPVVAFNVLVVLAPALSALVCFLVFSRYSDFAFARWLAGLFYGFSPFVLNDLADGHLHMTLLVFPPLVLALLDDLVVSQRGSALRRGALLGLVLAAQALTSLEVLLIVAVVSAAGIVLLAVGHPAEIARRWRRVATGLVSAGVTSGVLLAWPVFILARGPRRYKGSVFTSPESYVMWLKALVWPKAGPASHPELWAAYVGIPLVAILLLAPAWRRSPHAGLYRLCAALVVVGLVFAAGRTLHLTPKLSTGIPLPDRALARLPFVENLLPVRFMIAVDLLVALVFAVALGEARDRLQGRLRGRIASAAIGSAVAGAVGVVALAPPVLGAQLPYPTRTIAVPAVYRSPALTHLAPGSVLLAYPVMNGFAADPLIWQAEEQMPYDMVAGYAFIPSGGPHPLGSLPPSPVTDLFGDADIGLIGPTLPPAEAAAVRRQLASLAVSDVVVLNRGRRPGDLVRILTSILGRGPRRLDGAFVWLRLRPPALGS